ncbi:MAG: nitrogen regulation protein NR(II) [Promethearchaeota archaeon]
MSLKKNQGKQNTSWDDLFLEFTRIKELINQNRENINVNKDNINQFLINLEKKSLELKRSHTLTIHNLNERVKELKCLYEISKIFKDSSANLSEILQKVVHLIPPAWQYPEITCASLSYIEKDYITKNFTRTPWELSSPIILGDVTVGKIDVFYTEHRPEHEEGPFLLEERFLLNTLAINIGELIKRWKIEDELRKSKELLEKTFISLDSAIFILNNENPPRILDINPAVTRIFGYSKEEIYNETTEFLHVNIGKFKEFQDSFARIFQKDKVLSNFKFQFKRKNGEIFPTEIFVSPLLDEERKRIGWLSVIRDITKREQMEKELLEKQKLASIGQLAAGVAHELNTPLVNINLTLEVLSDIVNQNSEFSTQILEEMQGIRTQTNICKQIVKNLLLFSREFKISQEETDLKPLITEVILSPVIKKELNNKQIKLIKEIDDNIILFADRELIRQCFINLIRNSIDALEDVKDNPFIKIKGKIINNSVEIIFIDNGTGIKKEDLPRIFEPFFTTKDVTKGTGLGLAITRGIIEKHNGYINVKSKFGEGTEVKITLKTV